MSLRTGVCDYISYPEDVESKRLEEIGDIDAASAANSTANTLKSSLGKLFKF